jgi:hypothetical protein
MTTNRNNSRHELSAKSSGFEGELSEEAGVNQEMFSDLSSTAQAFRTRFNQKKSEQEEQLSLEQQASKKRCALLIQTVSSIRKSLVDVTRIDLGERFHFELVADDWNGWPRIIVRLIDRYNPGSAQSVFQVTAHDRHSSATIEIIYSSHHAPESISLIESANIERLPIILKRCVRAYLDTVEQVILVAEKSSRSNTINSSNKSKKHCAESDNNLDENLFEQSEIRDDIIDSLSVSDEIEALPEFL